MASVMKMFHNFKSSHLPRGKRSQTISAPAPASAKDQGREDPEGAPSSDLVNRRKVSISRSGRYRENNKRRCALPDDTRSSSDDDHASPKVATRADTTTKVCVCVCADLRPPWFQKGVIVRSFGFGDKRGLSMNILCTLSVVHAISMFLFYTSVLSPRFLTINDNYNFLINYKKYQDYLSYTFSHLEITLHISSGLRHI